MCTTAAGPRVARIFSGRCRRPWPSLLKAFSTLSSPPPIHRHGSLLLQSKDTLGIVSAVSGVILKHELNLTGADLHVEKGDKRRGTPNHDTFVCRFSFEARKSLTDDDKNSNSSSFAFDDADSTESFNLQSFEEHLSRIVASFHAEATLLHQSGRFVKFDGTVEGQDSQVRKEVLRSHGPARIAVFVGRRDHCLNDLLDQCRGGELPVQITRVISNFDRTEDDSHIFRALSRLNIPYHYVPCGGSGRDRADWEDNIMDAMQREGPHQTDFIVLARFMQILSKDFLSWYAPLPIINIHHGLLPSFKGSNPYRQAF